jgi:hypothetical protein
MDSSEDENYRESEMRDPNGKPLNEGDAVFMPVGFGQMGIGHVARIDLGLGRIADDRGQVAPAQPMVYILIPVPIPQSGVVPLFKAEGA